MTRLDKPIRREVEIDGKLYTLTVDPDGLKLSEKGRRKGIALNWSDLVSGDAALAAALQASTGHASTMG
ncbi:hypothetical protein [Lysobacter sp. Hz 25]|uniref:hypothetical protein n=1 Tax=Lysobacter sp. Hz 25 TaxID=3383698 RepID=UPI0038D36F83